MVTRFEARHVAVLLIAGLILSACSSDEPSSDPTASASPSPATPVSPAASAQTSVTPLVEASSSPTAAPDPGPLELGGVASDFRTGDVTIDRVLGAIFRADVETLAALVVFEDRACARNWSGGPPPPPPCAEGETNGMLVPAVLVSGSESDYLRVDGVLGFLERELAKARTLCAPASSAGEVRLRLLAGERLEPGFALLDQLTITLTEGRITALGQVAEPVAEASAHCEP